MSPELASTLSPPTWPLCLDFLQRRVHHCPESCGGTGGPPESRGSPLFLRQSPRFRVLEEWLWSQLMGREVGAEVQSWSHCLPPSLGLGELLGVPSSSMLPAAPALQDLSRAELEVATAGKFGDIMPFGLLSEPGPDWLGDETDSQASWSPAAEHGCLGPAFQGEGGASLGAGLLPHLHHLWCCQRALITDTVPSTICISHHVFFLLLSSGCQPESVNNKNKHK